MRALQDHDRKALGSDDFHRAPAAVRELERQIFEQLFEEENLRLRVDRRELLLAAVVEGLGDAVVVFDREMMVRFANPKASEVFGWESSPQGMPAAECIRNADLLAMLEDCIVHHSPRRTEIRHRPAGAADPAVRIYEIDVAPLQRTDAGSVDRARVVLHDMTEAYELEQVRQDFVANASHELRTPLTIINGYLENMIDSGIDDVDTTMRFLSVMQKHGDRIAHIIEDMLTISKLESHSDAILQARFDLRACAQEVVARLSPMIEQRQAKVTLEFPDDSEISGDAFYWDQILFNLIENALKENDTPGLQVCVSLVRRDGSLIVKVSDDGVGIPKAAQAFIFKRFYRVDQNRGAEKKGTGLGLSIVKRAVEAHGGAIRVHSAPGVETEFVIELPVPDS